MDNNDKPLATRYRPDIDGLRAVAVLSVVIYHLRHTLVPGGYVGVDIFFVISGFLISRNIWTELQAGRFSLADFYLRRIRRIAPAMFVVTAATLAAGMLLLLPADLLRLGRSAIWSTLSAANIYFWRYLDTSYFAAASDQEPLLHLWSLGVEEQYYLLWPAVLMAFALSRNRARLVAIAGIILICIASFTVAELTNVSAPKFSYYMLPARAGELMLGALLALWATGRGSSIKNAGNRWAAEACAAAGLGLIGFALWSLDDSSPFPGINALYPSVGATLVILAGHLGSKLTRALLTSRPIVFVGLVSYSLYLWHWPVLAFIRYFYGDVGALQAAFAVPAIALLSVLSYRFVEQPARHMAPGRVRQVMTLAVAPMLVLLLVSGLVVRTGGLKSMIESSAQFRLAAERLDDQTSASDRAAFPCMDAKSSPAITMRNPRCVLGDRASAARPTVLLWGDSNAGHFVGALDALGRREHFAFRYLSLSTCPALFGEGDFGAPRVRERCETFRESVRRAIGNAHLTTVVLASQWSVHDQHPEFRQSLEKTVSELEKQGLRVVLLGQVPWFAGYNRECEIRWTRIGTGRCQQRMSRPDQPPLPVSIFMEQMASWHPATSFVEIHDVLCHNGRCAPYVDNVPVYFNPTHLSATGSFRIGEAITQSPARAAWSAAFSGKYSGKIAFGKMRPHAAEDFSGFRPDFKYRIRSQRHESSGNGQYRHVVVAEYIDADLAVIESRIGAGLVSQGFSVEGPTPDRDSVRYAARRPGTATLVAVIHDRPALKLIAPGARGIVSFSWKDRQPR